MDLKQNAEFHGYIRAANMFLNCQQDVRKYYSAFLMPPSILYTLTVIYTPLIPQAAESSL